MGVIDEIMGQMHPGDGDVAEVPPMEEVPDDGGGAMGAAADDLIAAVGAKDSAGVAAALRAAFLAMEAAPEEDAGLMLEE